MRWLGCKMCAWPSYSWALSSSTIRGQLGTARKGRASCRGWIWHLAREFYSSRWSSLAWSTYCRPSSRPSNLSTWPYLEASTSWAIIALWRTLSSSSTWQRMCLSCGSLCPFSTWHMHSTRIRRCNKRATETPRIIKHLRYSQAKKKEARTVQCIHSLTLYLTGSRRCSYIQINSKRCHTKGQRLLCRKTHSMIIRKRMLTSY